MSTRSHFSRIKHPLLRFLSDHQRDEVHSAALEILEGTGVRIMHEEALHLLQKAGAVVNGEHVIIPEGLVKQALVAAPSRVVLTNRSGARSLFLESKKSYYGTGSCCPFTMDLFTGKRRKSTKEDVAVMARISDALPNIDFVMSMGLVRQAHPAVGYIHEFDAMVSNTTKPIIVSAQDGENVLAIKELAGIVSGNSQGLQSLFAVYSESTSPLKHAQDALSKLLVCAQNRIPLIHTVGIMGGATGPVTVAGALIQANAELMSALVIHQLKAPGAPFLYGGTITMIDMRTMAHPYGAPEFHLLSSALTEMGEYYGLPVFSTGGCSDAKTFDAQAASEAIYSLLLASLSGGNLIHDIGYIDSGLTSSLQQLVFSNEAIELIKHITGGISLDDSEMALDVIQEVGPEGNYLCHTHTLDHFKDRYMPQLFTRQSYNQWAAEGGLDLEQRIQKKTEEILQQSPVEELPPHIRREMDSFIDGYIEKNASYHRE